MSTPEIQIQEQPPAKGPDNKEVSAQVQQDPAPEKAQKPEDKQDSKAAAKEGKVASGKDAARAKAEGMLDYMFGKKKEEAKGCEHVPIGE